MKIKIIISFLLYLAVFSGCDINQPDRYYDASADKNPTYECTITNLKPDEHIAIPKILSLSFTSSTDAVKEIHIYIDTIEYLTIKNNPSFMLYPAQYNVGRHYINMYVVSQNKGLYTLLNIPQLIYSIPFIYDPAPPADVNVNPVIYKDNHPYISWTRSTAPNFYCYLINYYGSNNFMRLDTIYGQDNSFFSDTCTPMVYGQGINSYNVFVSNGVTNSQGKNVDFSYGTNLPLNYPGPTLISNRYDMFYSLSQNLLTVISTIGNNLINSVNFSQYIDEYPDYCLSQDGKNLIICSKPYNSTFSNVYIYDANTISFIRSIKTGTYDYAKVAAANDKIYFVSLKDIFIINSSDGKILNSTHIPSDDVSKVFVDGSNNLLYKFGNNNFSVYDISNDSIKEIKTIKKTGFTNFSSGICYYNNHLYLTDYANTVLEIDNRSLEVINRHTLNNATQIKDMYIANNCLYVGVKERTGRYYGKVYKISLDNFAIIDAYYFSEEVNVVAVSRDFNYLYAYEYHGFDWGQWFIVPLINSGKL
jgi:hypothetical protein